MKILCIGEALIDMICTDKGKKLTEGQNFLKKPGGAPANVAAAIAALGGEVELTAKVGTDPFGTHLKEVMDAFGVGTRWMLQDDKYFTTFAFVSLMHSGERDFYFNRGADAQLSVEDVEQIDVKQFSIVHFGSATAFLPGPLQQSYFNLLHQCVEEGIFISFDPNYRHLLFKDNIPAFIQLSRLFLRKCQFFKVSDEEAMLLTSTNTLDEAVDSFLQNTTAVFAITLGKLGTLLGMNGQTVIIPSIPVTAVDTTGAGDAFVGAVLYQLAQTRTPADKTWEEWQHIMQQANKAGARTCEYMGAMEAFKHLSNDIFK